MSVLAALGHAHAAGIVHRDVKPSNIMISNDETVKLLDFGIARRFDDLAAAVTAEGHIVGTPKYLAPEQIEGGPATPATDVYAVGVVLFEMITGSAPFNGDTPVAAALARLHAPAPDVRARGHDVPADLAAVIDTAMAREPAHRFTDAAAMQAALTTTDPASSTAVDRTVGGHAGADPGAAVGLPATGTTTPMDRRGRSAGARRWAGRLVRRGTRPERVTRQRPPRQRRRRPLAPPVSAPTTIDGVIAVMQTDPAAYGQHIDEIVNELVLIQQGDAPSERAATLLDTVTAWIANGEVTPAALVLLEPVLRPLIITQPDGADDNGDGGNGNKNGNGNGRSNGRGRNG